MTTASRDAILRDLAPTGEIRFALNHGNVVLVNAGSSEDDPSGITVDLAREFARRLGVGYRFVHHYRAVDVSDGATSDRWDVCFLAVDPKRARTIAFSDPYISIYGTYGVPVDSPAQSVADVERLGLRIGGTPGSAYTLFLERELKSARLVPYETNDLVLAAMAAGEVDGFAGVREFVADIAATRPGVRLIDEPFMGIHQAMATLQGRPAGLQAIRDFIAEIRAEGLLDQIKARHGQ